QAVKHQTQQMVGLGMLRIAEQHRAAQFCRLVKAPTFIKLSRTLNRIAVHRAPPLTAVSSIDALPWVARTCCQLSSTLQPHGSSRDNPERGEKPHVRLPQALHHWRSARNFCGHDRRGPGGEFDA